MTNTREFNNRVLVIDDNESIQGDFKRLLGAGPSGDTQLDELAALALGSEIERAPQPGRRYEVVSAFQGDVALRMVEEDKKRGLRFALAFVDMRMPPGCDGIETIEHLWEADPDLFCVICTAYSDHSWAEMVARLGETDRFLILKKPFDAVEIQQLAGALTTRWNLAQEAQLKNEELERLVDERTAVIAQQRDQLAENQELFQRDQKTAEIIFNNLMNRGDLGLPVFRLLHLAADTFSGDLVLALRRPAGGLVIMVGDFTGHGLAGAIGALPASGLFYRMTSEGCSIAELVPAINQRLVELLPTDMFLAACFVQIDADRTTVSVWNGGLPDALLCSGREHEITHRFTSTNLALGVLNSTSLDMAIETHSIERGDRLILSTDGVAETNDPAGEMFGMERLESIIAHALKDGDITKEVQDALIEFRGDAPRADDVTLLEYVNEPQPPRPPEKDAVIPRGNPVFS